MVSAQKPTAVTHSILGRFTSVNDLNLAICKSNQVEIYKVTAEGLKFLKQVAIWGIVENMAIIRLKVEGARLYVLRIANCVTHNRLLCCSFRTTRRTACC